MPDTGTAAAVNTAADTFRKSGYLLEDFRIFYNADSRKREIPFHYHDFHKLLLFLSGNVSYVVEGRRYDLQPFDAVPVVAGQIHRPLIHDDSLYERIIIYMDPAFPAKLPRTDADLSACFSYCLDERTNLIRPGEHTRKLLASLARSLQQSVADTACGADLLRRLRFTELLLVLTRSLRQEDHMRAGETTSNPIILQALDYINDHLSDEYLSVDSIAEETALNRSYLMHLFKAQTGYTIGGYIREKRLFLASTLIDRGASVTQACYESGFSNYAAFYYAFKKKYASAPARGHAAERQIEDE